MTDIDVRNTELSITLAAPEVSASECMSSTLPGYASGAVEITVAAAADSCWRLVRERAQEVWCTVKCRLGFLIREYRRLLREFLMLWEIAASAIAPARRVYAFRL